MGYLFWQKNYIEPAILNDSFSVSTHMELNFKLRWNDGDALPQHTRYIELLVVNVDVGRRTW